MRLHCEKHALIIKQCRVVKEEQEKIRIRISQLEERLLVRDNYLKQLSNRINMNVIECIRRWDKRNNSIDYSTECLWTISE